MNSMERLSARLAGKDVDRAPNLNILMTFAAKYAGIPYCDFILRPEEKCRANLIAHEEFGIDAVTVMSDPYTEAEAFGCRIEYPQDDHPRCLKHALEDYEDIGKLTVHQPDACRRMSNTIRLIELYKKRTAGDVPIVGWVEGPIAEFADIHDINNAMMDLVSEPEWAEEAMDICVEQAVLFAKAQISAGAHIIGIGDAAASLVGPSLYRDLILPREKKIVDAIHGAGAMVKLHICGNITPLLEDIKTLRCDIVDIDWMVDFVRANRLLEGISSVSGNLDPVQAMMNSTPEAIRSDVCALIDTTDNTSIISSGCEVPKATDPQILRAMDDALRNYPYK
ncbi:MAG: uroporphyrinogen decarboxylase family protein [Clostridia bacterium]|nr:uroporphyrinogen decarboxylase family protein [Clostridia bacterium]